MFLLLQCLNTGLERWMILPFYNGMIVCEWISSLQVQYVQYMQDVAL